MKNLQTILIVDDEQAQRLILSGYLKQKGYTLLEASSGIEALKIADNHIVDIVLSDFKMPDMTGIDLLMKLKERNPETSVVIITAFGTIENAVKAMKEGAGDYLTKPVNLDELDFIIKRISERQLLISENKHLKEQLQDKHKITGIVAQSASMENILNTALRVADSKATVLLRGESGTGKEVLAKAIHFSGIRKDKPFIAVNCAALKASFSVMKKEPLQERINKEEEGLNWLIQELYSWMKLVIYLYPHRLNS
jgi:DNA-binding NtrC family response regulator